MNHWQSTMPRHWHQFSLQCATEARLLQPATVIELIRMKLAKCLRMCMRCPRGERSMTARRLVQCSDRAANVWRPHSDRTANAQQARSKRAASAQQARSDQRCMKHVCCIEIHTDMQSHTYRYALPSLLLRNAYVNVCACMSAVYSRHTGTYALDTAPMIR